MADEPNPDLSVLLTALQAQHAALSAALNSITDVSLAQATRREAQEVLHRIYIAQDLVLVQTAHELTAAVAEATSASETLSKDLQTIVDAKHVIDGVTKFLTSVDKAIDIAKKLMPV